MDDAVDNKLGGYCDSLVSDLPDSCTCTDICENILVKSDLFQVYFKKLVSYSNVGRMFSWV